MIALARAAFLGHRVLQRDTSEPVLSAEQKLGWREFREQLRQHERDLEAGLREKQEGVAALLSEMIALAERMRRHRSVKIAKTVIREKRRLVALLREKEHVERRLTVALITGNRFDAWLVSRQLQDRPEDRRELADNEPAELYDRLYRETLLAQSLPGSLGELVEELRGHSLHLAKLEPGASDFPQIDAYRERIEQLMAELRRRGVTADADTLFELAAGSTKHRDDKLFNDARIRRTPPGKLSLGERASFRVEPFYLPPGSTLEVEWRWRPLGGRETLFAGKDPGKTRDLTFHLDESFWGLVPGPVLEQKGVQLVAKLYLDGSFVRSLSSEWVPFKEELRESLLKRVQVAIRPRRTIPEAPVSCRLTHWTPPGLDYKIQWLVNGEVVSSGPRRSYEPIFATPGSYHVAARIYRLKNGDLVPIHTTPEAEIKVSAAADLGRETVDLFQQQGLPGLSKVRPGLEKTIAALEEKVAAGGSDQSYWQRRLEAQRKRLEFFDREVPEASSVHDLDEVETSAEGSRAAAPVPAILLHSKISGPVPLSLYLVVRRQEKDRWGAKLIDLTGGDPLRYPGEGSRREEAIAEAVRSWRSENPYPKGGTVTFRCPGWNGEDHFSTTNLEKVAEEWVDMVLLVGGVVLLTTPEFTGSKMLGASLLLASMARAGYAIYENLALGVPWYDTRNVLEALSIVGSVAGLSGSVLRAAGVKAARTGVYRSGTGLVLFSLGTDLTSAVVITYQGLAMIRAIQDDPTLDAAQKASQLVRISAMLLLNGFMTIVSNRDLFKTPRGSLAGRALDPADAGNLGPRTRQALAVDVKRRGRGKELLAADGTPVSDRRLFELFCEIQAGEQRLTDVQAALGSDRARREFGRMIRSNRRLQMVDAAARVRLSRALEVPVHLDGALPAGGVRVEYRADGGQVRKIEIRAGAGTTLDDILRHAPAVQLLKRYRGLTGKLRSRLDRLRAFFGPDVPTLTDGRAFEAWGELLKLPGLISERRRQLTGRNLEPGDRVQLEVEVESLRQQLQTNLPLVEKLAQRRGYIAAEGSAGLPSHLQTVEQRWRIGEKIPEDVLADPNHYAWDTQKGAWTKLATPYFGEVQIKARNDSEEFFELSWEKEGSRGDPLIYLFYRPQGIPEKEWFADVLRPGKSFEDLVALARTNSRPWRVENKDGKIVAAKHVTKVVDLVELSNKAKQQGRLVRTSLAHPKMREDLDDAGIGEWETTHLGYERDPNRLFGKEGQIRWVANRLGEKGFHVHVSFPRPKDDKDIADLLTLVAHLNNYEGLRIYGREGKYNSTDTPRLGSPISHLHLGVMGNEQLTKIRQVIKKNSWSSFDEGELKWHFMAIRQRPYKDDQRIGIEFRVFYEGKVSTAALIEKTLQILRRPSNKFSLRGKPKYTLADLRNSGLVPGKSVLRRGVSKDLFFFLEKAAGVARHQPDMTIHSSQHQLLVRWSVSFLDWKKHPAVPESAHETIERARKTLIGDLEELGRYWPSVDTQQEIQEAIAKWANATNLWKHF